MIYDNELYAFSLGAHAGHLKDLSKKVKQNSIADIWEAALEIAPMLPKDCVLVPIPNHSGDAEYTWTLCNILGFITGLDYVEAVLSFPHESFSENDARRKYIAKNLCMFKVEDIDADKKIVLIDNTVTSGASVKAARKALKRDDALLFTITNATRKHYEQ